jgi:hypothetical protein
LKIYVDADAEIVAEISGDDYVFGENYKFT